MDQIFRLESLLPEVNKHRANRVALFALVNLGVVESLANGSICAAEAVKNFYFADNCLFVCKVLKDKLADRIMSHGVQLPDLFDSLPIEEAQREFLHELAVMRLLCLQLLEVGGKSPNQDAADAGHGPHFLSKERTGGRVLSRRLGRFLKLANLKNSSRRHSRCHFSPNRPVPFGTPFAI